MATHPASNSDHVRPNLRLFDESRGSSDGLSPGMRLSEFFAAWFLIIVLEGEDRHAGTITSYRESIAWWVKLTADPPIEQVTEFTIADFKAALRSATFRRGKAGRERPLRKYTVNKHLKNVRAVLRRAGPTVNPAKPCKRLVDEVPHISVAKPKRPTPKPTFSIDEARAIVAATAQMPKPRYRDRWSIAPRDWWHGLLVVLFYTGLRVGTVLKLTYAMVDRREDGHWLIIPGEIVDKTDKPLEKYLHPAALFAIERVRRHATDPIGPVFVWPHWRRHLKDRHDFLQEAAGIEPGKRLSLQAWRRAHSREMNKLGAEFGRKVAQRTLDHEDDRTTSGFYTDIEALLIARMPLIDSPDTWSHQQQRLFD